MTATYRLAVTALRPIKEKMMTEKDQTEERATANSLVEWLERALDFLPESEFIERQRVRLFSDRAAEGMDPALLALYEMAFGSVNNHSLLPESVIQALVERAIYLIEVRPHGFARKAVLEVLEDAVVGVSPKDLDSPVVTADIVRALVRAEELSVVGGLDLLRWRIPATIDESEVKAA